MADAAGDELRVLGGSPAGSGPARAEDLPLAVQALAVLAAGEEAGQEAETDELVAAGLGAVVFFASALREPPAAARRAAALQAAALRSPAGAPLLLGADQEGGRVGRLPLSPASLPAAMALGAIGDAALAQLAGRATAGQLQAVGVNWDLAPVCDVWGGDGGVDNPALGSRCFSADPQAAAALAAAFAAGLQAGGVLACAKHFPGHGDTEVDSHVALPRLAADPTALRTRAWPPFAAAARTGVASLMLGHLAVPAIGPLPASLEPACYRLAREELGFGGLLVTDSLGMTGCLRAVGGVGAAAVAALAAGADLVVVGHGPQQQRQARDALVAAVESGRLPPARLAEAVARVLAAKGRWQLARRPAPDEQAAPHLLRRPSDVRLAAEIARRSITELRPGPAAPAPAFLQPGDGAPGVLLAAARERWPAAEVRGGGPGPWLSLAGAVHLLLGPPVPPPPAGGRALLAYDGTPASLAALLECAAAGSAAEGRLPRRP